MNLLNRNSDKKTEGNKPVSIQRFMFTVPNESGKKTYLMWADPVLAHVKSFQQELVDLPVCWKCSGQFDRVLAKKSCWKDHLDTLKVDWDDIEKLVNKYFRYD